MEAAIRQQAAGADAVLDDTDIYGEHYTVTAPLVGPAGTGQVVTVWVRSTADHRVRFVTLKPKR